VEVDSRPSDAIALALRMAAPVFVRAPLFDTRDPEPGEPPESVPGGERT
jgi:bifunctional DNase/RNase